MSKYGIYDLDTGETLEIEVIEEILKEKRLKRKAELEIKYKKDDITALELEELMELKYISKNIKVLYNSFYKVNMKKPKPKEINHSEYGKFIDMLNFLSYKNRMAYDNGKQVKRQALCDYLEFKNIRGFNSFIKKLSKYKMLGESTVGGINYLFVNPAYAQRNMKLDSTIFGLFKEDLMPFLDEYQIKYLELGNEDIDINSVIPLQK